MGRHWNHLAIFIISSFIASMIGSTGYLMHWGDTPDMALGTSVLYLIPGVPLINAIMDIIDRDMYWPEHRDLLTPVCLSSV